MHWRKPPETSSGKGFYLIVLALSACLTVSAIALAWHCYS